MSYKLVTKLGYLQKFILNNLHRLLFFIEIRNFNKEFVLFISI